MNELALNTIRAFATAPTAQQQVPDNDSAQNAKLYLTALDALLQSDGWLQDPILARNVFSRLEAIEAQSSETRVKTRAIYNKALDVDSLYQELDIPIVRMRISSDTVINVARQLLIAESAHFRSRLQEKDAELDFTDEASPETLAHFASHLCSGETNFITGENAVELLLLAKRYGLADLSMKCLEYILDPRSRQAIAVSGELPPTQEESELYSLLDDLKKNGIFISGAKTGDAHVYLRRCSTSEEWESLTKLHRYLPVTHLALESSNKENFNMLATFVRLNPHLVSLDLGASNLGDEELENLSQDLPNLNSFSISFATITKIPDAISKRVTTLECKYCRCLTSITAPLASTLTCIDCDSLTAIDAPLTTTLMCSSNPALKDIRAPLATTLICNCCDALTEICAPLATLLNCISCPKLTAITAPLATTFNCGGCRNLAIVDAPSALALDCANCRTLTAVQAPLATTVTCDNCPALTTIDAPVATDVHCSECHVLTAINAPLVTTLDCSDAKKLTTISAPLATTIICTHCRALTTIHAPSATTLDCKYSIALVTMHAPLLAMLDCSGCDTLTAVDVPLAETLDCSACDTLADINAPLATKLDCSFCTALATIHAPSAATLYCQDSPILTAIHAPVATTLNCCYCPALTAVHAPLLTAPNRTGCRSLTRTTAPELVFIHDKVPAARRLNQAVHYDAVRQEMIDEENPLTEQYRALILECEFKAKLLRNESLRGYIDLLTEKLRDPATAEAVVGEVADFSRWAKEVGDHEHLAQWLFNLKEEIRLTIAVVHTHTINRLLLREQYAASREAQNQHLLINAPEINLSLFLNNERLRNNLRDLYAQIETVDLYRMSQDLERILNVQLPLLYPGEQDHTARKARILSLLVRIPLTKDYEIDPEGVGKRLSAVVKSICTYGTVRTIERNIPYLKSLLEAIEEGAAQCQNRAADALSKSEEVYFQIKFKNNRPALYGIELMLWKRRFVEQFVRLETMPAVFGQGEGAGWDIEIIMENSQIYSELLDLNIDIKGISYLDNLKRWLAERGLDGQEIANPQELFKALMEQTTTDKLIDLCLHSPVIQKLHGVNASILETPQDVRVKAGTLLAGWGKPLADGAEESKDCLDKLGEMLHCYRDMEGFADLQALFDASIRDLRTVYAVGNEYDEDKEIGLISALQIALSNMHDAYRQQTFQDSTPGGFRSGVIKDLIEAGYLLLPQHNAEGLFLDYQEPNSLVVDPNGVIEATLQLNVEDWPAELFDAPRG